MTSPNYIQIKENKYPCKDGRTETVFKCQNFVSKKDTISFQYLYKNNVPSLGHNSTRYYFYLKHRLEFRHNWTKRISVSIEIINDKDGQNWLQYYFFTK